MEFIAPSPFHSWLMRRSRILDTECRELVLRNLHIRPGARILDVGCGDGELTQRAATRIGTDRVLGLDIVVEALQIARTRAVTPIRADLNAPFPLHSDSVDLVIASHCIEHLCDTDLFLGELNRVLHLGGDLVLATPNLAAWHQIFLLSLGRQPTIAEVSDRYLVGTISPRAGEVGRTGPAHRRVFTRLALSELLARFGFKVRVALGSGYFPLTGVLGGLLSRIDPSHATNVVAVATKVARADLSEGFGPARSR